MLLFYNHEKRKKECYNKKVNTYCPEYFAFHVLQNYIYEFICYILIIIVIFDYSYWRIHFFVQLKVIKIWENNNNFLNQHII